MAEFGTIVEDQPEPVEFGTVVEQSKPEFSSALEQTTEEFGTVVDDDDPTLGEIGTGLVADIALAEGSKYAGAATFGAIGSIVPGVGTAIGATAGYVSGAIGGGITGSIAAQKIEGRDEISWGRVVGDTLLNFIPGSKLVKGGSVGSRIIRAGLKQGAIGSVVAPAAQTVESLIDTGKIPTKVELMKMAGMGGALGFGLGGASVGLEKLFGKIGGKTTAEVDEMVATGDLTLKDFKLLSNATDSTKEKGTSRAPIMEGLMQRELEQTAQRKSADIAAAEIIKSKQIAAKGKGTIGKIFASLVPSKVIGRKSQQAAIDFGRSVNEAEELGSRLARNLEKRIGGDEATNDLVNKLLDGEPVPISKEQYEKLGSSLADIQKYQEMRLKLQEKMVSLLDEGAYKGLDENGKRMLQDAIQDSIAGKAYNRREYKIFLDPKYEPDAKLEAAAFNELAVKMGPEKAKAHMDKLQNASAATRIEDSRSFMGAPVDSVLRRKHNPGKAERAWLGEVTEAPERIRGTLSGMGKSAARADADSRIARSLVEDGIASRTHSKGLIELRLRGTGPEGTGVYVNPEVQVALNNIYLQKIDKGTENIIIRAMEDLYRAGVAGSKASKVLFNTIAYPVQLYGNTSSLIGMGVNPFSFKNAARGAEVGLSEFGRIEAIRKSPSGRKALLDDIQQMSEYGIKNSNILDSDIRKTLDNGIFSSVVSKITDPLGKLYSVPDTMGRYIGWKSNQNTLRKIFPDASEELIKREAAHLINDTYQNYDKLSSVVRTLSRWGVMPQFASFTAEFARNQYNQGIILSKMLGGVYRGVKDMGKPNISAMRIEGAKRLAGMTAVYGATYMAIQKVKALSGLGQDDEDALRNLSYADYDKNKELMVSYDKKSRKGWTANPSYIVPHAIGISAFKAGLRGDDKASVVGMIQEELIGEGSFIAQEAFRALMNRKESGEEITNEINGLRAALDKIKYFISESFQPGVSKEFDKLVKAKRGAGDLTLTEVGQRQLGLRRNAFDLNKIAKFAFSRSNNPAKQQASSYYSLIKWKEPSAQEANAAYEKAEYINKDSFNALVKNKDSMKQLGFSESEIIKAMKDGNVSSKRILSVLDGNYKPLPRVQLPSVSDRYDELTGGIASKRKQIMEIRKTDRSLAKKLMNRLSREQKANRRGITSKDDLLKNLDIAERASIIAEHPNPRGYLKELQRKGIATKEVTEAVRLKLQ